MKRYVLQIKLSCMPVDYNAHKRVDGTGMFK